ncbi:hypothetical protein [Humibacter ginsenosidimutans]|uniref:Uncharacterized protein n=1 Tax=Humibacter ginsenosidimutans TaxID=2599293 RepID=A0A5B8M0B7_9MICO|nr:hypothetical protein [Humibacter ginsenosidimutans]QDZ14248.1 hypothetical protein FPZ11_05235 [Humibacter ginsenosidimutans]
MSSTFTDAQSNVYTPAIVNTLTWNYTPGTVDHDVLNDADGRPTTTNVGPGIQHGHLAVVFEDAGDADAFARAAQLGIEFTDPDHFLNNTVLLGLGPIGVTQDDSTKAAFVVEFDWKLLS